MSLAELDTLMPHRPPMRWIGALIECTDSTAVAEACFGANDFAASNGILPEAVLVECAAQTVAAAQGRRTPRSRQLGSAVTGMLAAVTNFQIKSSAAVGQTLRMEVREVKRFGPMLLVAASISCEGRPVAAGELTLYA